VPSTRPVVYWAASVAPNAKIPRKVLKEAIYLRVY
jgi:hypothetical protein